MSDSATPFPLEFSNENLVTLIRKVKKTLDPENMMNPSKVVFE
jgi:FAD/FMN-containing dehydrogenase